MKDDRIRSSLIECQSFSNRKININPIYRVLMFVPSVMQVLCTTWFIEVNLCRILMLFVSGINRQEEYCLSLAWILTSIYQSIVDDRMKIKKHIQYGKYVGIISSELSHCPVMKDQWDYVLNVLEELGDKQLFLKYQCNTDISFLLLLLLPSIISNDRPTTTVLVEIDSEDKSLSSNIELLRRLLIVLFESVCWRLITFFEISFAEREESPGSISIHFLSFIGMMLG